MDAKAIVFATFKEAVVRTALLRFIGTAVGWRAMVLAKLIGMFIDKFIEPAYLALVRNGTIIVAKEEIKASVKKLKEAASESELDDAIDSLQ